MMRATPLAIPESRKQQLLNYLIVTRQEVLNALEGLTETQYDQPHNASGETARSVLPHLIAWHWPKIHLLQQRAGVRIAASGPMDADRDATNAQAEAAWRDKSIPALRAALDQTRADLLAAIAPLSDADLIAPAGPPYEPSFTLLRVLEGTAEHNAENAEKLQAWRESLGLGTL